MTTGVMITLTICCTVVILAGLFAFVLVKGIENNKK